MDRVVRRRGRRWLPLAIVGAVAALAGLGWWAVPRGQAVDAAALEIATVEAGQFHDELLLRANAVPLSSVMLDATEGGRVEAVYARDGATVKKGELLFKLSNPQRQQEMLARESDVAQQVANLATLKVGMEASRAEHRRQLAALEYELDRVRKRHARDSQLAERGFLSAAALEESRDQLAQQQRLLAESRADMQAELGTRQQAIAQMDRAIVGLDAGLKLVRATADALAVRAPNDGRLTDFRLEEGESVKPGDRLGRIDSPGRYKLAASVDEFYLNRVALGLRGEATLAGRAWPLALARLNPQVKDGRFGIELQFDAAGAMPAGLQPGQGVEARLTLGQPARALLLPDGAFYADTGGSWLFVLDAGGSRAERRAVRLGRRAANRVEVLGGLRAGERVIVSSYRDFREAERLRIEGAT
ncbi:efflux RND transporter periplasmic adaptor subunit [Chitinimonas koreensis]|uniref:efflux RND transporter periplasmic adaptor subunit n=1 Tax=Chitinimonas koreensis TaxID=356302 RepID=UPI00042132DC|nr:efflux RND transporter periplasmic adaptor subunit [Chitinimonas koreensis]QNM97439.1 efflux RND transporter periplasmic adaptor subunit [Chitinimonas koreensis]